LSDDFRIAIKGRQSRLLRCWCGENRVDAGCMTVPSPNWRHLLDFCSAIDGM